MESQDRLTGVPLTPRQRRILSVVVQQYVDSANPVGSSSIRMLGELAVSTATIRNELVALEEAGFLAQPHTSAGRVPTIKGYRYYVEQLMERIDLPLRDRLMIKHQFHQLRLDLDQWLRLAASVLAHAAQSASIVTAPHAANAHFRHLELISINDATCLLVLVLQDGGIHQEMLVTTEPVSQAEFSRVSNKLNDLLRGLSLSQVRTGAEGGQWEMARFERSVLERIISIMTNAERRSSLEVYRDGLANLLSEPEFTEAERREQLVELFERHRGLDRVLAPVLGGNGVQIIIGGEGTYSMLDDLSMILSPYGVKGKATGVVAVIGPTRMAYARGISAVRYMAEIMDGLMVSLFDHQESSDNSMASDSSGR